LLIDMPPGTGDISLSLSQFVAGAYFIIVTTPQAAAMRVAARAGYAAEKLGLSIGGVIENMAFALCDHCGQRSYPFGQGGGQELADLFQVPLLGQIPLDPPMRELADHGKPSVVAIPSSPSARAFEAVVDEVLARYPPKPRPTAGRKNLPLIMGPNRPKPNGDGHAHHHIHGHGD
ncbi:MAG: P-loop NTPase, partial [Candidatus Methylomirabilales bacterium]